MPGATAGLSCNVFHPRITSVRWLRIVIDQTFSFCQEGHCWTSQQWYPRIGCPTLKGISKAVCVHPSTSKRRSSVTSPRAHLLPAGVRVPGLFPAG